MCCGDGFGDCVSGDGGEEGGVRSGVFAFVFHFSLIGREERVGIWVGLGWAGAHQSFHLWA